MLGYYILLLMTHLLSQVVRLYSDNLLNKIIQEFKLVIEKGIPLNSSKILNTILLVYADDQILMATSEDELQIMAYHLNQHGGEATP